MIDSILVRVQTLLATILHFPLCSEVCIRSIAVYLLLAS